MYYEKVFLLEKTRFGKPGKRTPPRVGSPVLDDGDVAEHAVLEDGADVAEVDDLVEVVDDEVAVLGHVAGVDRGVGEALGHVQVDALRQAAEPLHPGKKQKRFERNRGRMARFH